MSSQIHKGDRIIASRIAYTFSPPQRGDVIIFKFPDNESENYIKRIIGMPGDTVEIKNGVLSINNHIYDENYLKEPMLGSFGPYHIPEGHYFMLGDNRNISYDSRYWDTTCVSKEKIIAKAIFKYYASFKFIK